MYSNWNYQNLPGKMWGLKKIQSWYHHFLYLKSTNCCMMKFFKFLISTIFMFQALTGELVIWHLKHKWCSICFYFQTKNNYSKYHIFIPFEFVNIQKMLFHITSKFRMLSTVFFLSVLFIQLHCINWSFHNHLMVWCVIYTHCYEQLFELS